MRLPNGGAQRRTTTANRIRVFVVDDHPVVRAGIRREIAAASDICIVGEAASAQGVPKRLPVDRPDVLLLDVNLPDYGGSAVIAAVQAAGASPAPRILIYSAFCEREIVFDLIAAGAHGYLLKDEPPGRLVSGIRALVRGEPVISAAVQKQLMQRRRLDAHGLSAREVEILRSVARGRSNDEMATTLGITSCTVRNHITNIYGKLPNVQTRAEAVAWAWANGLVRRQYR